MSLHYLPGHMVNRRAFLGRSATGIGAAALAAALHGFVEPARAAQGTLPKLHFAPKAKRIIFMTMAGGMSHLETFDHKPKLAEMHGQAMPESITKGQPIAQLQGAKLTCFGPQHAFKKVGQSGQNVSEIFPKLAEVADELCIINSLKTE
ncbi:MAG TPA: DUF1501 domain-containing protein, partial [Pirellulaceae bacterium]|nr:DUF1501 domain-containing protein [Pirellulaceae bacterium]